MARSGPSKSGKGKGRCVGSLWVTIGHIRVTVGHLRVTVGHPRVTIGHLRVTIGYFFISKHEANTTELHPKVRQTCLNM